MAQLLFKTGTFVPNYRNSMSKDPDALLMFTNPWLRHALAVGFKVFLMTQS